MNGQSVILPADDDDTIELVLSPEQLAGLSQAAEAAQIAAPTSVPVIPASRAPVTAAVVSSLVPSPMTPMFPSVAPLPLLKGKPASRFGHWHQTPIAKMAANTVAFVAFAWWSVAQLAGQPQHPQAIVTAAVRPIALVHLPVPAAPSAQQPAVQVVNPFDSKEVFQFPAGTSDAEGRAKVAQILMQRARERQSKWEHIRPEAGLRTASLATVRKW